MKMSIAIEYIHPDQNVKWVAACDDLNEAIAWIRDNPTITITNMAIGDGYSVTRAIRLWKVRDAEKKAIQEPDTPANIRPDQERRGMSRMPERY